MIQDEENEDDESIENQQIPKSYSKQIRDAKLTLQILLDLLHFSKNKTEETEEARLRDQENYDVSELKNSKSIRNVNTDNVLYILLFFDALIMINIEMIRKLSLYSKNRFNLILFGILNSEYIDNVHKEIASHVLSSALSFVDAEVLDTSELKNLMQWTYGFSKTKYLNYNISNRDNMLTSNLMLLLSVAEGGEYFVDEFDKDTQCLPYLFKKMIEESNYNTIYEYLFTIWNITNNKKLIWVFENKRNGYVSNILQVIKTNKVDKIARIGLMMLKVLFIYIEST